MTCPFLITEKMHCSARPEPAEDDYIPSKIELEELCKGRRYSLCYLYFGNYTLKER